MSLLQAEKIKLGFGSNKKKKRKEKKAQRHTHTEVFAHTMLGCRDGVLNLTGPCLHVAYH